MSIGYIIVLLIFVLGKVILKIVTLGNYPSEETCKERKEVVFLAGLLTVFIFILIVLLYS